MRRLLALLVALLGAGAYLFMTQPELFGSLRPAPAQPGATQSGTGSASTAPDDAPLTDAFFRNLPMSIAAQRARRYPGSALSVVQTLPAGVNYRRQVVSYQSDGLTIYALLTVPTATPPAGGWPAIVFNHGYIPPTQYRTTERYVAYQDAFARAGFVTLKSDYRGHGRSQGEAAGGYDDPGYTTDVLNAAASLRQDARVNPARLGMWGHSMGGHLTLRAMVIDQRIKAGVIWAGVVASYDRLRSEWNYGASQGQTDEREAPQLDVLNAAYVRAISPNSYLRDLGGPLQLHAGTADKDVPYVFQKYLADDLKRAGVAYEAYRYEGDNHNLSGNLGTALRRSVAFFRAHL